MGSFQEELDDIIRYGSKELFVDETEEAKARQIHYDDAAIDRFVHLVALFSLVWNIFVSIYNVWLLFLDYLIVNVLETMKRLL